MGADDHPFGQDAPHLGDWGPGEWLQGSLTADPWGQGGELPWLDSSSCSLLTLGTRLEGVSGSISVRDG